MTQNLRFSYEGALHAARQLWQLADEMEQAAMSVGAARAMAVVDFSGPMRTQFDDQNVTTGARLRELAGMARGVAAQLGRDWASARGQQDRINYHRWVEHERSKRNVLQSAWQWAFGEGDYGAAPDNPSPATAPGFRATRPPQYPQFGP